MHQESSQALRGKVVVLTGASSGIGRASALAFARSGANVVLAARRTEALNRLAQECRACGVHALAVPTDVTVREEVNRLASAAIERFGHIDVWVNNAAVLAMGRFEDTPLDAFRRVLETNFFGRVYGIRAVLPHFRARRRGVLIDVGSVLGMVPQPYASAYVASKFAGRGLLQSLRIELLDAPQVHVCSVLPAPIDTPIYQEAANFTGREIRPMWPLYDPDVVARAILRQAVRPRRQVIAGGLGQVLRVAYVTSPTLIADLARIAVDAMQLGRARVDPPTGT